MKFRAIKGISDSWLVQERQKYWLGYGSWNLISLFATQEEAIKARDFYEQQEKRP